MSTPHSLFYDKFHATGLNKKPFYKLSRRFQRFEAACCPTLASIRSLGL
jgi:hypothetical protein